MKRSGEQQSSHSSRKRKREDASRKPPNGHFHDDHASKKHHSGSTKHQSAGSDVIYSSWPNGHDRNGGQAPKAATPYSDALSQLPPPTSKSAAVPSYVPFPVSRGLPTLPPIQKSHLATAAFKHKSLLPSYDRNTTAVDISYERLEFLGDAYIELIASRVIFERFSHLPAGQQSQLRELLVKNETLAEFSRAYKFDQRIETGSIEKMLKDLQDKPKWQGNKGWTKILGDVFEAYVAAVILADEEYGFSVAETWLTSLWAPKLVEAAASHGYHADIGLIHDSTADLRKIYNPNAKQELQKRILGFNSKLEYESHKPSMELKGDQLGQNKHFIALYLTGYGHERKMLGKGEGKNKVEAGNWAATEAMHGDCKQIVEDCEKKLKVDKEKKKAMREAKEAGHAEA